MYRATTQDDLVISASPTKRASSDNNSLRKNDAVQDKEAQVHAAELAKDEAEVEHDRQARHELYMRFRPFILGAVALLILGWWISATVLPDTRHRW